MLFYVWFPHKTRSKYFHKKANKQKTLQEIYFLFQLPKTQTTHSKRDVKKYKKNIQMSTAERQLKWSAES